MSTQTTMAPFKGQSAFIDYCLEIAIMELGFPKGKALDVGIHYANVLNLCFIFIVVYNSITDNRYIPRCSGEKDISRGGIYSLW